MGILYESYVKLNSVRNSHKFRRNFPRVQVLSRNAIHNLVSKVKQLTVNTQEMKSQAEY